MGKKIDFTEFSRKGGNATKEKHGSDFYRKISGGSKVLEKYGKDHYKRMSQKSIEARKKKQEEKNKNGMDKLASMITG